MNQDDLFSSLPLNRKDVLAAAIGSTLVDIERLFSLDQATFLEDERYREEDFFSENSGPAQFRFANGLLHGFAVWSGELSVSVLEEPLASGLLDTLYRLNETTAAPAWLRACLGRRCEDVRIWTFKEDFESEEAKQAGVSYVLSGGVEVLYAIYLHGNLDSDSLITPDRVKPELVASCYSLAEGRELDLLPRPG